MNCEHVERVMLCGRYASDLAVRFQYSRVPADRIEVGESIAAAAERLRSRYSQVFPAEPV